jgi:competence protein ComEC
MYHILSFVVAFFQRFSSTFEEERPQWLLWMPVALGTGILIYFNLSVEPSAFFSGIIAAIFLIMAWYGRQHNGFFVLSMFLGLIALGISVAGFRTYYLATPMLNAPLLPHYIEGTIENIEYRPGSQRLILSQLHIEDQKQKLSSFPDRVRISFRGPLMSQTTVLQPGMRLRVQAVLIPPTEAVAPGAYDFRRRAYFEGIGAVGYALQKAEIVSASSATTPFKKLIHGLYRLRHQLTMALRLRIDGLSGEIAAALVTGDRSGLPEPIRQQYADAGIAHILAISGLHLSIVASIVFFCIRNGCSLIPSIALRYPTKKWAAGTAIVFTLAYMLICGAPIPAQRAFLMTLLVLIGILTNRLAVTLRNTAMAAMAILLVFPEALMSPSFQLSFAAVTALVAGHEALQKPLQRWKSQKPRFLFYGLGIILSTVLATLATTPYIIAHFHRLTLHALPANLFAVPLVSFVIMPGLILMLVLMPFGWDGFLHRPLHCALDVLTTIAGNISRWPGSVILIPMISPMVVSLLTYGLLMLALFKTRLRYVGGLPIGLGLCLAVWTPQPDLYISSDGRTIGLRTPDGKLWSPSLRSGRFVRENWLKMAAQPHINKLPKWGEVCKGVIVCQAPSYYFYDRYEIVMGPQTATVIDRQNQQPIVDSDFLYGHGGTFVWLQEPQPRFETVRTPHTQRPWTLRPIATEHTEH